jgi:hypothetical protein
MSDDKKCFADGVEVPYRGAGPTESMTVVGTTKPFFIELPFDDSFLNREDVLYAGGRTLEEAVEHLGIETELEGSED